MKLWQKISAAVIAVMLVIMSTAVFALIGIQSASMLRTDEENTLNALNACRNNVLSAAKQHLGYEREITQRSIVQYLFSEYAAVVQDEDTQFALVQNGEYLYNMSPDDPAALLPAERLSALSETGVLNSVIVERFTSSADEPVWVGCRALMAGEQEFIIYISRNAADTEARIVQMRWIGVGMLLLACGSTAVIILFLLRRLTRPVVRLMETAGAIADGAYHLRSAYASSDEIGQLSAAFDRMAEAIEGKISALRAENERRKFLLGALSHELRTPMTAVIGYGETLLHMPLIPDQRQACAEKIVESGRRAEILSQKMMELVGLSGERTITKTRFLASRLVQVLCDEYGERIQIHCEAKELYGDETLLYSLTANLIRNALRASVKGECVEVLIRSGENTAEIIVKDHGCGIPKEHIPRLTEPFYRVDKARSRKDGGAGLGLSICKMIAEAHGGSLVIESEAGQGTTVSVQLPLITT